MKIRWAIILVVLVGIGLIIRPNFALTNNTQGEIDTLNKQIEERKKTIQQLEDTINQYKKNIEQKQTEASSLKNQLGN